MRIVLNTRHPNAAASLFYSQGMRGINGLDFGRWDSCAHYDVALFMPYPEDLSDLVRAKEQNPRLRVGLIDARGSQTFRYMRHVDFLVLDSLEMSDFFAHLNKPIFCYVEYMDVPAIHREHKEKSPIIVGYHGNRAHLMSMFPAVTTALETLGKKREVEFWAIYNVHQKPCVAGMPRNVRVRHIQWHPRVYEQELAQCDIGIAPALVPIPFASWTRRLAAGWRVLAPHKDDYFIRFKMPSNPGRVISFAMAGVPVVASFLPSFLQYIRHGETGYLAHSAGGWYRGLEALATSPELRKMFSSRLQQECVARVNYRTQNAAFVEFLKKLFEMRSGGDRPIDLKPTGVARWNYSRSMLMEDLALGIRKIIRWAK